MEIGLLAVFGYEIFSLFHQSDPLFVVHADLFSLLVGVENPAGRFQPFEKLPVLLTQCGGFRLGFLTFLPVL